MQYDIADAPCGTIDDLLALLPEGLYGKPRLSPDLAK